MKPVTIYSNNTYINNIYFTSEYKKMVQCEIIKNNKKWNDINEIIMVEERYKR